MKFSLSEITKGISNFFVREAGGGSSAQITNSNLKNFIVKKVGWNSESEDYTASEFSLAEIKQAIETDSLLKASLDKIVALVLKNGYRFESSNDAALEYLRQRIKMAEFGTGVPFDLLLNEISRNLIYYSNCFVIKSRMDKIQGGLQAKPVLGKKPVAGWFIADPTIIEIKRSKDGTISGYKLAGTEEKEFKPEDVIHLYIDRDAGSSFGTPKVIACLEDLKVLRKIESSCLGLIYRFSYPMYHAKVGLPEPNLMATNKEVEECQKELEKSPLDGILVSSERLSLHVIGADGNCIDLAPYLEYFERRIFSGLGQSLSSMGRESSASSADMASGLLTDIVKYYQLAICTFLENGLINEILLEGAFNPILDQDSAVKFKFAEVNLDSKVKIENHLLNQYQNNCITLEELRIGLDRATTVDEGRLYTNLITTPSHIAEIEAKLGGGGGNNLTNGAVSNKNGNGQAKSIVNPSNQHGTTSAKMHEANVAESLSDIMMTDPKQRDRILQYRLHYQPLYNKYKGMRNNIIEDKKFSDENIARYKNEMCSEFDKKIEEYTRLGTRKGILDGFIGELEAAAIPESLIRQSHNQINNMIDDIAAKVNVENADIGACMDYMEYRLRFACDFYLNKVFNYAQIKAYEKQGIESVDFKLSKLHSVNQNRLSTSETDITKFPPFSPYCSCTIVEPEVIPNGD